MPLISVSFAPEGERKKKGEAQRRQLEKIRARERSLSKDKRQLEKLRALAREIGIRKRLYAETYDLRAEEYGFTEVEIDQPLSLEHLQAAFDCDFVGECESAARAIGRIEISGPAVMWVEPSRVFETQKKIKLPFNERTRIWQREIEGRLVLRLILDTQQQDLVFWGAEHGRSALAQLCKLMAQRRHYAKVKCLAEKADREEQEEKEEDEEDEEDEGKRTFLADFLNDNINYHFGFPRRLLATMS